MSKLGNQAGQSIIEFIIIMPMFFVLLFGIFEFTFIYKAKVTLNTATFEAARAGSLNHGKASVMEEALAKGMAPLYMKGAGSAGFIGMSEAYITSFAVGKIIKNVFRGSTVEIISPSPEVVEAFSVKRSVKLTGEAGYKEATFIPSDNLYFRASDEQAVEVAGETHMLNVQDANILKVRTFWCYEMKTPLVSRLIRAVLSNPQMSENYQEQRLCNRAAWLTNGNYLAIRSHSVVRMQTHFLKGE